MTLTSAEQRRLRRAAWAHDLPGLALATGKALLVIVLVLAAPQLTHAAFSGAAAFVGAYVDLFWTAFTPTPET